MNYKVSSPLAESVRQTQKENPVVDLVYNEETGEFEQVAHGNATERMVVADMTKGDLHEGLRIAIPQRALFP